MRRWKPRWVDCLTFLYLIVRLPCASIGSPQGELVKNWADKFGNELWSLGKIITKSEEIKSRYNFLNAQVEKKDPNALLAEIVTSINRMMDRKMDAIWCIMDRAERAAEEFENGTEYFEYYNSKYSQVFGGEPVEAGALEHKSRDFTMLYMNKDTHFYNLPVNTSHSSVHVPTNVFDLHDEPKSVIQWSKSLDEVFVQNYNSDPALSWQYFGSSTGIMRHYPALQWVTYEGGVDLFDCRIRTWFIEAATCTKDIIILLDNSGSMTGMGKHVASLTVSSILDTFSNNDYINIMVYNDTTKYLVDCFNETLVQATEENIQVFKEAVSELKPDEKSDLIEALEKSFKLLQKYRDQKNCTVNNADCNQLIMVVTDGVSDEVKPIIERYNYLNNGSNIPVRIFTYLIGKEVINRELIDMACSNRGYYTQIQSLEQVTESVFQYIPVIARPLVLKGDHPISWTHAYTDITYDDSLDDQINEPYRLLTSVAIPAFDLKVNNNNDSRVANLLGVAATDVPIDDISKLTLPYTIGVNAYAFIVSNNGYLLMHPDLRPVYKKHLKVNYNSVDLMDVEQMDDGYGPRVEGPLERPLRQLRLALVNAMNGTMQNINLKYHYDKMRRVSRETYDYFYAPLKNTPFTIALAIPDDYGQYSLKVDDEIQKNRHTGRNITSFFTGSNWKVHPKWVYCKYHYLEGHEFNSSESELLDFLRKIDEGDINFKWESQYEAFGNDDEDENLDKMVCGRKTLNDDDYYCDKQLMQRLVFDAKNTMEAFKTSFTFNDVREESLFKKYNATLRFVATMSGLTRWEYIFGENENNTSTEFGDLHSNAIDEVWYKSAVLQHEYDKDAFVYSVPFEFEDPDEALVTGSYAIFPKDASHEAPGSVVGFQFSHSHMKTNFETIANKSVTWCPSCYTCKEQLACYVIDSSGYIVISYNNSCTGQFFGEVEPVVMQSMLNESVFEMITVYDFQALCFTEINVTTEFDEIVKANKSYPCEKQIDLFVLQQNKFDFSGAIDSPKPYYLKKIPYSNLLLVAVMNASGPHDVPIYTTQPRNINYNVTGGHPCQKLYLNTLERKRLVGCINEHELEHEIKECGGGNRVVGNVFVELLTVVVILLWVES